MTNLSALFALTVIVASAAPLCAQVPIELDGIAWSSSFEAARQTALESKQPLFVVFR